MKTQIKNYSSKILLTLLAAIGILTGTAAAQKPDKSGGEFYSRAMRAGRKYAGKMQARKAGAVAAASNGETFQNGKDLTMAIYDADQMDSDDDALNYTILDLVYLIDRLDGQPEAAPLQKTLRSIVRGTTNAAAVKKDIETVSTAYLKRQTAEQKWYYNAGRTSMNLLIASYSGADADIKKGLTDLQALVKTAPKNTLDEILNPMKALDKFAAQKTFADADYTAIYEGVGGIIDVAVAA